MAKHIGELIKKYRSKHHIGMSEFGRRCGLSKAYISYLEANKRPGRDEPPSPSLDSILAISAAMEMDPVDVMNEIGLNIKDREKELRDSLLVPLSTGVKGRPLEPFEYIKPSIETLQSAIKERRVLILPFTAPRQGDLVYVPMKQYDMAVAHVVMDVKGGVFTVESEAGGRLTFSIFDVGHAVFMTRRDANAARARWSLDNC